MDGFAYISKPGTLFAEDFDSPEAAPEPEVIEPLFSPQELADARDIAWREGHTAGLVSAAETETAATRQAVEAIALQMKDARDAAAARAEQSAEAVAGLLLDSLAATFPALCVRYGDAEVRAIAGAVLPALTQEPDITVRANPLTTAVLEREITLLDPDLAAHVRIIECDAMPQGDVRIAWHNGAATRDAAALWQQVAEILVPAGLLRAHVATKETIDGN